MICCPSDFRGGNEISMSQAAAPIHRNDGVTAAERYLNKLCERSFLSLWSYSGIYRDQGRRGDKGDGKEVCDLLVVFENNILIFSDKDCELPDTGNLELDWARWFRRAIQKSADQVWGAERWIKSYPDRLFLDRACTRLFPIELPNLATAKFHRIVVAHEASKRCKQKFGGTGSLMIKPTVIGSMHYATAEDGGMPFVIGEINPAKGYVHVFDDTSLSITMKTLDTITDFVAYLSKKEEFILSGRLGMATGEDDLLACYLGNLNGQGEHDFIVPPQFNAVFIDESHWQHFSQHPQRLAQLEADRVSYSWDQLIETFSKHIFADTQYFTTHPGIGNQEKLFRFLAREPRTRRRMLAAALLHLIHKTPKGKSATRVMLPSHPGDPHYVFLLLPEYEGMPYSEYRELRQKVLEAYCMVTKLNFSDAEDIVGIATEPGIDNDQRSEDALYYDARDWTDEERAEAERLRDEVGLLRETKMFAGTESEFPEIPTSYNRVSRQSVVPGMKGRNRNAPCACGSGKKYKKCCG